MNPQNDHDLLIRVDTKLGTLIGEVQLMRDNSNQRITQLENHKVDKEIFGEFKIELTKQFLEINQFILNLEKRSTKIENKMIFVGGILAALQVLIPIALRYYFKY